MRRILQLFILVTILAVCLADCRAGLNGRLDYYECTNLELPLGAVGIEISGSSMSKLSTDVLSLYGDSLEEFNITGCGVEEIEVNAFRGLDKLRVLGLANNKIRKLDASWLQDLPNLEVLSVWGNEIVEIDRRLYDLLPKLEIWDIAHNHLVTCLPSEFLKKLTELKKIYISGNPWSYRCRAAMTWYLGTNHIRFIQDWGTSDMLIEECLAHEAKADIDDDVLKNCVARKTKFNEFEEMKRNLTMLKEKLDPMYSRYYG